MLELIFWLAGAVVAYVYIGYPLLLKLEDPLATGRTVKVDLDVAKAGDVELALRYAVVGAGWTPSYSARLDPGTGRIELEVYGVVTQSTGEDWHRLLPAGSRCSRTSGSRCRYSAEFRVGRE